jgi:hypothetical protein
LPPGGAEAQALLQEGEDLLASLRQVAAEARIAGQEPEDHVVEPAALELQCEGVPGLRAQFVEPLVRLLQADPRRADEGVDLLGVPCRTARGSGWQILSRPVPALSS